MVDYSLHILDLVHNSFKANATNVSIAIEIDSLSHKCKISISDNGIGMTSEEVSSCTSPFYTKRTNRKVGLGIPLFVQSCEQADGYVQVTSSPNKGTSIIGCYDYLHIDALPLGDLEETIYLLMIYSSDINVIFEFSSSEAAFQLSTMQMQQTFQDVSLTEYEIMVAIKEYIKNNINNIRETFYENVRRSKENA